MLGTRTEINYERTPFKAGWGMNLMVSMKAEKPKHALGYLDKLDKNIKSNPDKMNEHESYA
jgi:hypothetical protein